MNHVSEFIDPVRELKPALKWSMNHTPVKPTRYFKAGFNSRTGSMNSATDPGCPTDYFNFFKLALNTKFFVFLVIRAGIQGDSSEGGK